jgi:uncharacterized membrane protein
MSQHDPTDHDSHEDEEQTGLLLGRGLSIHRIEALADGVFAVAMTLLVFNVQFPDTKKWQEASTIGDVVRAIFFDNGQGPILIAYLMSFVLLGVYWVSHHVLFQYIRRATRLLSWINIIFLMLIAFVPFTTHLVGVYYWANDMISQAVVIIYGVHLMLIGGFVYLNWWYATHRHCLVDKNVDQHVMQSAARRILMGPAICLVACLLSIFNTRLSVICYLLIPLCYIVPGHIDQHWGLTFSPHRRETPRRRNAKK